MQLFVLGNASKNLRTQSKTHVVWYPTKSVNFFFYFMLSVFHLEACDDRDGNALRYSLGSDNYYLRMYSGGKVMLRVSLKEKQR